MAESLAAIALFAFFVALAIDLFIRGSRQRKASYITPLFDARSVQVVEVDAAGVYVLYHEVLQGMRLFSKWRYLLWDVRNKAYIESRWAQSRKVGGMYTQRWQVRYFDVPAAGDYQLVVDGLEPTDKVMVIIGRYAPAAAAFESFAIVSVIAAAVSLFAFFVLLAR